MEHKKEGFLKFIILYKAVWGVAEVFLAVNFYRFLGRNGDNPFNALAESLRLDPDNGFASAVIAQADSIDHTLLLAFAAVIFIFGVFNLIESWGLHRRLRWAEWLTVIATALLIPYELYHVIVKFGLLKLIILVINILIVYYLARHKELFRSWKEARLSREKFL